MSKYQEYVDRKRAEFGDRFDPSNLHPQFRRHFDSGVRIQVTRTYDNGETWTRTGTVGATTGWRPSFLLVHRSSDTGSSDLLGPDDKVTAVQVRHGKYLPVG